MTLFINVWHTLFFYEQLAPLIYAQSTLLPIRSAHVYLSTAHVVYRRTASVVDLAVDDTVYVRMAYAVFLEQLTPLIVQSTSLPTYGLRRLQMCCLRRLSTNG